MSSSRWAFCCASADPIMTDAFKALFDELHAAEDQIDTAGEALEVANAARRKVRDAIWAAIDRTMEAHALQDDLRTAVQRLETRVLELTARLPPTNGTTS
jgi:uncharacterized membrane protein YccC